MKYLQKHKMRTNPSSRLNKGFCSNIRKDKGVRQETSEDDRKIARSKGYEYNEQ